MKHTNFCLEDWEYNYSLYNHQVLINYLEANLDNNRICDILLFLYVGRAHYPHGMIDVVESPGPENLTITLTI